MWKCEHTHLRVCTSSAPPSSAKGSSIHSKMCCSATPVRRVVPPRCSGTRTRKRSRSSVLVSICVSISVGTPRGRKSRPTSLLGQWTSSRTRNLPQGADCSKTEPQEGAFLRRRGPTTNARTRAFGMQAARDRILVRADSEDPQSSDDPG
jgi:hypothetical protein